MNINPVEMAQPKEPNAELVGPQQTRKRGRPPSETPRPQKQRVGTPQRRKGERKLSDQRWAADREVLSRWCTMVSVAPQVLAHCLGHVPAAGSTGYTAQLIIHPELGWGWRDDAQQHQQQDNLHPAAAFDGTGMSAADLMSDFEAPESSAVQYSERVNIKLYSSHGTNLFIGGLKVLEPYIGWKLCGWQGLGSTHLQLHLAKPQQAPPPAPGPHAAQVAAAASAAAAAAAAAAAVATGAPHMYSSAPMGLSMGCPGGPAAMYPTMAPTAYTTAAGPPGGLATMYAAGMMPPATALYTTNAAAAAAAAYAAAAAAADRRQ